MTTQTTSTGSGGIGLFGFLGLLFIGLKLTGYITWSWWWVLAPFWIGFAIMLVALAIAAVFGIFVFLISLIASR